MRPLVGLSRCWIGITNSPRAMNNTRVGGLNFSLFLGGGDYRVYPGIKMRSSINKDNLLAKSLFLVDCVRFKGRGHRKQCIHLFLSLLSCPGFLFCLERLEEDLQVVTDLTTAAVCLLLEGVFDFGM